MKLKRLFLKDSKIKLKHELEHLKRFLQKISFLQTSSKGDILTKIQVSHEFNIHEKVFILCFQTSNIILCIELFTQHADIFKVLLKH